jgi:hypothetical protein
MSGNQASATNSTFKLSAVYDKIASLGGNRNKLVEGMTEYNKKSKIKPLDMSLKKGRIQVGGTNSLTIKDLDYYMSVLVKGGSVVEGRSKVTHSIDASGKDGGVLGCAKRWKKKRVTETPNEAVRRHLDNVLRRPLASVSNASGRTGLRDVFHPVVSRLVSDRFSAIAKKEFLLEKKEELEHLRESITRDINVLDNEQTILQEELETNPETINIMRQNVELMRNLEEELGEISVKIGSIEKEVDETKGEKDRICELIYKSGIRQDEEDAIVHRVRQELSGDNDAPAPLQRQNAFWQRPTNAPTPASLQRQNAFWQRPTNVSGSGKDRPLNYLITIGLSGEIPRYNLKSFYIDILNRAEPKFSPEAINEFLAWFELNADNTDVGLNPETCWSIVPTQREILFCNEVKKSIEAVRIAKEDRKSGKTAPPVKPSMQVQTARVKRSRDDESDSRDESDSLKSFNKTSGRTASNSSKIVDEAGKIYLGISTYTVLSGGFNRFMTEPCYMMPMLTEGFKTVTVNSEEKSRKFSVLFVKLTQDIVDETTIFKFTDDADSIPYEFKKLLAFTLRRSYRKSKYDVKDGFVAEDNMGMIGKEYLAININPKFNTTYDVPGIFYIIYEASVPVRVFGYLSEHLGDKEYNIYIPVRVIYMFDNKDRRDSFKTSGTIPTEYLYRIDFVFRDTYKITYENTNPENPLERHVCLIYNAKFREGICALNSFYSGNSSGMDYYRYCNGGSVKWGNRTQSNCNFSCLGTLTDNIDAVKMRYLMMNSIYASFMYENFGDDYKASDMMFVPCSGAVCGVNPFHPRCQQILDNMRQVYDFEGGKFVVIRDKYEDETLIDCDLTAEQLTETDDTDRIEFLYSRISSSFDDEKTRNTIEEKNDFKPEKLLGDIPAFTIKIEDSQKSSKKRDAAWKIKFKKCLYDIALRYDKLKTEVAEAKRTFGNANGETFNISDCADLLETYRIDLEYQNNLYASAEEGTESKIWRDAVKRANAYKDISDIETVPYDDTGVSKLLNLKAGTIVDDLSREKANLVRVIIRRNLSKQTYDYYENALSVLKIDDVFVNSTKKIEMVGGQESLAKSAEINAFLNAHINKYVRVELAVKGTISKKKLLKGPAVMDTATYSLDGYIVNCNYVWYIVEKDSAVRRILHPDSIKSITEVKGVAELPSNWMEYPIEKKYRLRSSISGQDIDVSLELSADSDATYVKFNLATNGLMWSSIKSRIITESETPMSEDDKYGTKLNLFYIAFYQIMIEYEALGKFQIVGELFDNITRMHIFTHTSSKGIYALTTEEFYDCIRVIEWKRELETMSEKESFFDDEIRSKTQSRFCHISLIKNNSVPDKYEVFYTSLNPTGNGLKLRLDWYVPGRLYEGFEYDLILTSAESRRPVKHVEKNSYEVWSVLGAGKEDDTLVDQDHMLGILGILIYGRRDLRSNKPTGLLEGLEVPEINFKNLVETECLKDSKHPENNTVIRDRVKDMFDSKCVTLSKETFKHLEKNEEYDPELYERINKSITKTATTITRKDYIHVMFFLYNVWYYENLIKYKRILKFFSENNDMAMSKYTVDKVVFNDNFNADVNAFFDNCLSTIPNNNNNLSGAVKELYTRILVKPMIDNFIAGFNGLLENNDAGHQICAWGANRALINIAAAMADIILIAIRYEENPNILVEINDRTPPTLEGFSPLYTNMRKSGCKCNQHLPYYVNFIEYLDNQIDVASFLTNFSIYSILTHAYKTSKERKRGGKIIKGSEKLFKETTADMFS